LRAHPIEGTSHHHPSENSRFAQFPAVLISMFYLPKRLPTSAPDHAENVRNLNVMFPESLITTFAPAAVFKEM